MGWGSTRSPGHPGSCRRQARPVRQRARRRVPGPAPLPPRTRVGSLTPASPGKVTASHLRERRSWPRRGPGSRPGAHGTQEVAELSGGGPRREPRQRRQGRGQAADTGAKDTSRHGCADPGCTAAPSAPPAAGRRASRCVQDSAPLAVAAPSGPWWPCGFAALDSAFGFVATCLSFLEQKN